MSLVFSEARGSCEVVGCQRMVDLFNSTDADKKFGFGFETEFDYRVTREWLAERWTLGCCLVAVYLVFIFGAQEWMKQRERFRLQGLLVLWNMLLAGFSIFGSVRMVPEMLDLMNQPNGFHRSVCSPIPESSSMFAFWTFLFVVSKAPELGDTVFIVLRKQPLIFLHWYHHVTVLLYSWHSYIQYIAPSRWFVVMNFSVHALMYSYYVLKALKIRVPKPIALTITSLQILQMLGGIIVNVHALSSKLAGWDCDVPYNNIFWALAMYGSYCYLFAQFFRNSYLTKGGKGSNYMENKKLN